MSNNIPLFISGLMVAALAQAVTVTHDGNQWVIAGKKTPLRWTRER